MTYRIDLDRSLAKEVRRIAVHQLDAAIDLTRQRDPGDLEARVHAVRKHTKRVRSLVRLVEPALGADATRLHRDVRAAAQHLADVRDAQAVLATLARLTSQPGIDVAPFVAVHSLLSARAARVAAPESLEAALVGAEHRLLAAREGVTTWSLPRRTDPAIDGAARAYVAARTAWKRAAASPDDERMHTWRKRVKDTWYHSQLLRDLAPRLMQFQQRWAADLSEGLGDHNDLAVLVRLMRDERAAIDDDPAVDAAVATVVGVQAELARRNLRGAAAMYLERPSAHRQRLRQCAHLRRHDGPEPAVGGLDTPTGTTA